MDIATDSPVFDMYEQYALEREGLLFVRHPFGFASYKVVNPDLLWVVDIFVIPSQRRSGVGSDLSSTISAIARKQGISKILGSIDIKAVGVTDSMKALLADGFYFSRAEGNIMYFFKDLPKGN